MLDQAQLDSLFNSFNVSAEYQYKLDELRNSFDENHVEIFLEKLEAFENIDELLADSSIPSEHSNQFIDFVSELIVSKSFNNTALK